jgi:NAD(P)-dependent dehydrogenase (short-subunit alcohol dehydrogenase family)
MQRLAQELSTIPNATIDYVVINAGIMKYPNRATEMSFNDFAAHLHTNTVGPIICAQKLLQADIRIKTIVFMSSDSGSAQNFRAMEDGFAAYAASKAALNQALRHMAAELKRAGNPTTILALHPGEVKTDMANINVTWEVEGQMEPRESVAKCLDVIESRGPDDSGTFWTWEGERYPW